MPSSKPGIFICYRRGDTGSQSSRLHETLERAFGAERVFMDVSGINPGADFVDALKAAVASCRVMLVMIGETWLSAHDERGRRLDDPQDFVRLEVASALSRSDVTVIPVLINRAEMPAASALPPDLEALATRHALRLFEDRWKADVAELLESCEPHLGSPRRRRRVLAIAAAVAVIAIGALGIRQWGSAPVPAARSSDDAPARIVPNATPPPSPNPDVTPGVVTPKAVAPAVSAPPTTHPGTGRVLYDDDFVSEHRLGAQTRFYAAPSYCRTSYVQDGILVEAVHADEPCEYVLYAAPFMPTRVHLEVGMRLRKVSAAGASGAYGIRLLEAKPDDPDSPLTYHGAIVNVDDFEIVEARDPTSRILLKPNAESYIRAGTGATNVLGVDVDGQALRWVLNGVTLGTVKAREALSGSVTVYLKGQGTQVVFRNMVIADPAR